MWLIHMRPTYTKIVVRIIQVCERLGNLEILVEGDNALTLHWKYTSKVIIFIQLHENIHHFIIHTEKQNIINMNRHSKI